MKRISEKKRISTHINNWIDLIFGCKEKGKESENIKNIFTEETYQESVDLKIIWDKSVYLRYIEFGLIPTQIMVK